MGFSVGGLAARQLADYRAHTPGTLFGEEDHPRLTLDEAYAVQAEVARLRAAEGEPVAGYKVGATGAGVPLVVALILGGSPARRACTPTPYRLPVELGMRST